MARLVIEVEVNSDPTLEDPHVVAEEIIDSDDRSWYWRNYEPMFVSAEWGD